MEVINLIGKLFDPSGFPPRWHCGEWSDFLGWVHIISDIAIWLAYFSIPASILFFVFNKEKIHFPKVYYLFAAFIFFCGITHLNEAIIFWNPIYRFQGLLKLCTAIVSWMTVVTLIPAIPKALGINDENKDA